MNWDAVGAIAELVGSIAVLATLIYLALQVRHGREELRRSSQNNRQAWLRDLQMEFVRNPDLRDVNSKVNLAVGGNHPPTAMAIMEAASLSEEEAVLMNA